jgi:hypothetical protein
MVRVMVMSSHRWCYDDDDVLQEAAKRYVDPVKQYVHSMLANFFAGAWQVGKCVDPLPTPDQLKRLNYTPDKGVVDRKNTSIMGETLDVLLSPAR